MKDFGVRLIAEFKGKHYHLASLEFKLEKRELIYVFKYFDIRRIFHFNDFGTGEERIQKQIDHISFHRDGHVHIYYKDVKGNGHEMDRVKLKGNPFDLPGEQYAPLLIHSFVFDAERMNIQPEIIDVNSQDLVFAVPHSNKFSVVLFSTGAAVNYKAMLGSHGFDKIFDASKSKFFCEPFTEHSESDVARISSGLFTDTGIALGYTERTIPIPLEIIDFYKSRDTEIGSIAPFSVLPSDDKIRRLQ